MMWYSLAILAALAAPSQTPPSDLEAGFAGAIRGCEEWILEPASWANGTSPFLATVGLGDKMGLVDQVDSAALPPRGMRRANHYWRINSTLGAGFILVVSDQLPMCHITGGGNADLKPAVENVLGSMGFASRWEKGAEQTKGGMISTTFRSREDGKLSIVVSRAKQTGQRQDRVQVLVTGLYQTSG